MLGDDISSSQPTILVAFKTPVVPSVVMGPVTDGAGQELVEADCSGCHSVGYIERALGYSAKGWATLAETMITLDNKEELAKIVNYLARHYHLPLNQVAKGMAGEEGD